VVQWKKNSKDERKEKLQAASAGRLPDTRERERERERERAHLGNDDGT
jgi:hypothetical protein